MWHLFHQQRFLNKLICFGNHTNIIYPDLYIRYCENCIFILNTFIFDNIVATFLKQIHFIRLHLVSIKSTVNLAGLFYYFQHGEVFLLARDGVQYPRFLLFTQELIHYTQDIFPLLPKNWIVIMKIKLTICLDVWRKPRETPVRLVGTGV